MSTWWSQRPGCPGLAKPLWGPTCGVTAAGKGGNSAVAAVRSGADVRYVGAVGDDDLGTGALAELRAEGIDLTDVAVKPGCATGAAVIVVDSSGENQIAVAAGANTSMTPQDVSAAMARARGWAGCVLVSTEISAAAVTAAVEAATKQGCLCVLNPAPVEPSLRELLDLAPIITPNSSELRDFYRLLGESGNPPAEVMAAKVAAHSRAPVVVTMGGDGVLVCDPDGSSTRVPAGSARRVADTTGAGDTFNGVFAASLAAGEPVISAARRGVAAATLSVESTGARTGMPRSSEIEAALAAHG